MQANILYLEQLKYYRTLKTIFCLNTFLYLVFHFAFFCCCCCCWSCEKLHVQLFAGYVKICITSANAVVLRPKYLIIIIITIKTYLFFQLFQRRYSSCRWNLIQWRNLFAKKKWSSLIACISSLMIPVTSNFCMDFSLVEWVLLYWTSSLTEYLSIFLKLANFISK